MKGLDGLSVEIRLYSLETEEPRMAVGQHLEARETFLNRGETVRGWVPVSGWDCTMKLCLFAWSLVCAWACLASLGPEDSSWW